MKGEEPDPCLLRRVIPAELANDVARSERAGCVFGCGLIVPDFQRKTVALDTSVMLTISVPLSLPMSFSSSI